MKTTKRIVSIFLALLLSASVCTAVPAFAAITQDSPVLYYSSGSDYNVPIYVSGKTPYQTEILVDGKPESVNLYFGFTNPAVKETNGKFVTHVETTLLFEFTKDVSASDLQLAKVAYQPVVNNTIQEKNVFNVTAKLNTQFSIEQSNIHDGEYLVIQGDKTSYHKGDIAALVFETNVPLADLFFFGGWELLYINGVSYQKQYVGSPLTGDMVKVCTDNEYFAPLINKELLAMTTITSAPATESVTKPEAQVSIEDTTTIVTEPISVIETGVPVKIPEFSFLAGDCNSDGTVNILDIIAINKYILGTGSLQNKSAADVDKNGIINTNDVLLILKTITEKNAK